MHICFASLDYPGESGGGGVGTQVKTIGRELARLGHDVTVVALDVDGTDPFRNDLGVNVYRVTATSVHWYVSRIPILKRVLPLAIRDLEYGWAIWQQVRAIDKQQPIDLVEATETAGIFLALQSSIPFVVRLHGEQYTFCKYTPDCELTANIRLGRQVQRIAIHRAKLLTSPSKAHAKEIERELGLADNWIQVVPNALPFESIERIDVERISEEPVVLYVGRLQPVKGVLLLIEAFAKVINQIPSARLLMLGSNHPSLAPDVLDRAIHQSGIGPNVEMLGHIPHSAVVEWYGRATIAVLPSYYETFGLAVLEPMAFGLPVIAFRSGALPELVSDGDTGILVEPNNPDALADQIIELLLNPSWCRQLGQAAQEQMLEDFAVDQVVAKLLRLYGELDPKVISES